MLTNITRILKSKAGLAIIALSVVILLAAAGLPLNTYRAGWEIGTELVAMRENTINETRTYPPTANIQDDFDEATWGLQDIKAPLGANYWEHETSLPASWACFWGQGGTSIGKAFDGGVFARFSCLPWGMLDYGPIENYTFNGYYLGVMNAKIESHTWGKVADIETTYKEWVRNVEAVGSPLNM